MTIGTTGCPAAGSAMLRHKRGGRSVGVRLILSVLTLSICACAPLTEQEQFEREDRLNLAKEDYQRKDEDCQRAGGAMQMQATPLSKFGRHDYKTAKCVRF